MSQRPLQSSHKRLASYSLLRRTLQTKALLRPARPLWRDGLNDLLDLVGLTVFCFKPVKKGSPPKPGVWFIFARPEPTIAQFSAASRVPGWWPRVRFIFRQTEAYPCTVLSGLPGSYMAATRLSSASIASWKRVVPSAHCFRQKVNLTPALKVSGEPHARRRRKKDDGWAQRSI